MPPKTLPGFRDFYPEQLAERAYIFETWRRVVRRYAFVEYDGPPLESLDLYTQKSGDEIVTQLYNFVDKGGRDVALRPEMTPTFARMVGARAQALRKPVRWFSLPQLFRYERTQKGRLREHFQLNVDLIGEAGPLADAEVIAVAIDSMRELGLSERDVRVRVSDRRLLTVLLNEVGFDEADHPAAFQLLDKLGRGEYAGARRVLVDKGASESAIARLETVKDVRVWADLEAQFPLASGSGTALRAVFDALGQMGLGDWLDLDLTIVRGLAYYTGTVFELFDASYSLRAICGGGRYDNLLKALGGVDLPALGFGMGDVVLSELLKERGRVPSFEERLDVFLAAVTDEDVPHILPLAHQLRDAGLRVEFPVGKSALAKQLKLADARKARYAVVVGPDDRARGQVVLKDLSSGSQEAVATNQVAETIEAWQNRR